ncbi:MAG: hypothetical protein N3D11_17750 [Candidatus Sumerlaeia bacterium]|nr:hypothetical protein [Candidatus Sumerlaeia bacterium]
MIRKSGVIRYVFLSACAAVWTFCGGAQAVERPVVIESFSGISCTFCYGAGMALDRIGQDYTRREVLIVTYHEGDEFALPFCTARRNYYVRQGSPIAWFNGIRYHEGGSSLAEGAAGIQRVYDEYAAQIRAEQDRTSTTAPFLLRLTGRVGPDRPELTLHVRTGAGYPRTVKVHFLITENGVPVADPPNGKTVLNGLARAYLGERSVSLGAPGTAVVSASFSGTIPFYSGENLQPLVFLQDDVTKEIVAAVGVLSGPAGATRWSRYK